VGGKRLLHAQLVYITVHINVLVLALAVSGRYTVPRKERV
jgi:hypothetical protein